MALALDPQVLIACDGYRYGGRDFDRRREVAEIAAGLPGLREVVTWNLVIVLRRR